MAEKLQRTIALQGGQTYGNSDTLWAVTDPD